MATSRTQDQFGRDITIAWRKVIHRDNDSHVRVHVFAGVNQGARGRAGELTFRAEELDEWALTMEAGGAERLEDLDLRATSIIKEL